MIRINEAKAIKTYLYTMMYKYGGDKYNIDLNYQYFKTILDEAYQLALEKEAQKDKLV